MKHIVVSLTTIAERIKLLPDCLTSLMTQTTTASKIYINIPIQILKGVQTVVDKVDPKHEAIVINIVVKDLGPITKLVPILDRETNGATQIVLVDDDIIYDPRLIATLTDPKHQRHPAVGLAGRTTTLEYKDNHRDKIYLLETFAGVRYHRHMFPASSAEFQRWIEQLWDKHPQCQWTDDIVIAHWINRKAQPIIIPFAQNNGKNNSQDTPQLRDKNLSGRNKQCLYALIPPPQKNKRQSTFLLFLGVMVLVVVLAVYKWHVKTVH